MQTFAPLCSLNDFAPFQRTIQLSAKTGPSELRNRRAHDESYLTRNLGGHYLALEREGKASVMPLCDFWLYRTGIFWTDFILSNLFTRRYKSTSTLERLVCIRCSFLLCALLIQVRLVRLHQIAFDHLKCRDLRRPVRTKRTGPQGLLVIWQRSIS